MRQRLTTSEYRAMLARRSGLTPQPIPTGQRAKGQSKGKRRGEMNKWESDFAQDVLETRKLAKVSRDYRYEAITLRLARGVKYTPDFPEWQHDNTIIFYEVKGFWRAASRIRIKMAAELYPMWKFVAVTKRKKKEGGGWIYENF